MTYTLSIAYDKFDRISDMELADRELIASARSAAEHSYSPYSHFAVGAAARVAEGAVESAANVESEVFPAGICAERNLLFGVATRYPGAVVEALAVVSISNEAECYPCGVCRQTLLDVERRQGAPIRVIMAGEDSATVVESAASLLPFGFKLK
ncbi:MAG: cytidine deaminase [Rikenellaceae bacterium]